MSWEKTIHVPESVLDVSREICTEEGIDQLGISAAKTGSPKAIIKLAYSEHLIDNEDTWIRLVNDRNDDAHIYSESAARAYASRIIRDYMPFIEEHVSKLQQLIPAGNQSW